MLELNANAQTPRSIQLRAHADSMARIDGPDTDWRITLTLESGDPVSYVEIDGADEYVGKVGTLKRPGLSSVDITGRTKVWTTGDQSNLGVQINGR
jgi:hypothetical protein